LYLTKAIKSSREKESGPASFLPKLHLAVCSSRCSRKKGAGPRRIAEQAKCSEPEAKKMLASFRTALPTLNRWIDMAINSNKRNPRESLQVNA
jgi:hypothetical protein